MSAKNQSLFLILWWVMGCALNTENTENTDIASAEADVHDIGGNSADVGDSEGSADAPSLANEEGDVADGVEAVDEGGASEDTTAMDTFDDISARSPEPQEGLGTVTEVGECTVPGQANPSLSCRRVSVDCPDIAPLEADLLIATPPDGTAIRGVVVVGSGGYGTTFYPNIAMNELRKLGFVVVNRKWAGEGWESCEFTLRAASCRYASLVTWVRAQPWATGPLCVTGNSGGSAEISYALTLWNREEIIDFAVPTSGPPMGRVDLGCLLPSDWLETCTEDVPDAICGGEPVCPYNAGNHELFDSAYPGSPCADADESMADALHAGSVMAPDADLDYPNTPVHFVFGSEDCTNAVPQGFFYVTAIESEKAVEVVPAEHSLQQDEDGVAAIAKALDEHCICRHPGCGAL